MKILADQNIPCVEEAFSRIGSVEVCPGREISREKIKNSDVLLVRTVTKVDESLLCGTAVQFVGTATIGYDHVDVPFLRNNGTGFSCAAGSNANSVAEYVLSALFALEDISGLSIAGKTAGVIGCGNVGSLVLEKLEILGVDTLVNDPPLLEKTGNRDKYLPVETLMDRADIITVHTPLVKTGRHPTQHMCGRDFFSRLKKSPVFINTSRGAVADSAALGEALDNGAVGAAVLDVWENEPDIDAGLLKKCALGTPHIAGYSLDGKVNATRLLFEAVCRHFKIDTEWAPASLPPPENPLIKINASGVLKIIGEAVLNAYNIRNDDASLRKIMEIAAGDERERYFDSLRNNYPVRREFKSFMTALPSAGGECEIILRKLGFNTTTDQVPAPGDC